MDATALAHATRSRFNASSSPNSTGTAPDTASPPPLPADHGLGVLQSPASRAGTGTADSREPTSRAMAVLELT
uniref:Uncharacterized protein n=1 Tax=Setaria italica TaxID=4555 RepID=K3YF22_SETIT